MRGCPLELLQRGRYQPRDRLARRHARGAGSNRSASGASSSPSWSRPVGATGGGVEQRYEIIAGERRWRAAQLAGLTEIARDHPRDPGRGGRGHGADRKHPARGPQPARGSARAFERLIGEFGLTHQQVADAVGRSRADGDQSPAGLSTWPRKCARLVEKARAGYGTRPCPTWVSKIIENRPNWRYWS